MRRLVLLLAMVVTLVLGAGRPALAHTSLHQALPAPDSTQEKPPASIALQFTEEVEAQFGAIAVYDHTGVRVDTGDAALDPRDVTRVVATLKDLGDGLYTVAWRVVSADGHPISGSYGFTVGKGIPGAQYYQPTLPESGNTPPPGVLVGYWLAAVGAMAVTGLSLFQWLVARNEAGPRVIWMMRVAFFVALAGSGVYLVFRTAQVAGVSVVDAINPSLLWRMLLTVTGRALFGRIVLLMTGLLLMQRLGRRWWFGASWGAAALITFPLSGHAVAVRPAWLAVSLDSLHLVAAAAWLGGLLQFAVAVPSTLRGTDPTERPVQLGGLVRRFSVIAGVSVLLLVGTALYPVLLHVPSQKALLQTAYGMTLQMKVALFGILVLLGGINLLSVGPRLRRGVQADSKLTWLVRAEAVLMALVLGAAALLTNVPPARVALPPEVLNVGMHTQNYAAIFDMNPLAPGYRTLNVTLEWHEGTLPADTQVTLELIMKTHDMGKNLTVGTAQGIGRYRFENVLIGMPGIWEFRLNIARPGAQPDTVKLGVEVPEGP